MAKDKNSNLLHGRTWLLLEGRTGSPPWPVQKPEHMMKVINIIQSSDKVDYGTSVLKHLYLAHHTGGAPDVSRRAVVSTNQNLHRAVLTRLDVLSEVFMLRTRR